MKRMLFALAVTGMAAAGSARADWGGATPPPVQQAGNPPPGSGEFNSPNTLSGLATQMANKPPERYGLLPGLRRVFRLDRGKCHGCEGAPVSGGYGYGYGNEGNGPQAPPVMQGTLVFPQHPFVRSPRDFFMTETSR